MKRVDIKICGLTNAEDALLAAKLGATRLGFIFAKSPRQTNVSDVRSIVEALEIHKLRDLVETIGVFVNEPPSRMADVLKQTGLDTVQIHGDESHAGTDNFNFRWYRALRIASVEDVRQLDRAGLAGWHCNRLLFDASVAGVYGGSGVTVDRDAAIAARIVTHAVDKEFFIAGGISPDNVASIIETVLPDGIDVGSGVEESPGRKSHEKLKRLFMEIDTLYGTIRH